MVIHLAITTHGMTDGKPTAKEIGAWIAINNPTGMRNNYVKVANEGEFVRCAYYKGIGSTKTLEMKSLTKEGFIKEAGFDSLANYVEVKKYYDNQPVKFFDLRQGMVVWSETLRNRFTILQKKDKDSVYVRQHNHGGRWGTNRKFLSREEVDTGFFKKSKEPTPAPVEKPKTTNPVLDQVIADMDHAKDSEYATD